MHDLTVLTLVPNAGERLKPCLESVAWADEIFCVVDARSDDGSLELARKLATRVEIREYLNAADQRNWALPQIETEWTLVLDADEWVSEDLLNAIRSIIKNSASLDGYDIRRQSYFFGKLIRHCGWHRDYNLRLFRTRKGRYLEQRVHSRVVVDGEVGRIVEPMFHDTYRSFEEYFDTALRFSTWSAEDAFGSGRRATLSDLTLRPLARWFRMYVFQRGFLDGYHGAVLCGLSAHQVFLKYAKLWNLQRAGTGSAKESGADSK